jgi:two-component system, OmpR family, KDP operon response regulator KdpE
MNDPNLILVIDDEVQIQRLLNITLSAHGYRIMEAFTGKEGLLMAASHSPSLVILDLGLPDISGHDVLKNLRDWYKKPVIILSVRNEEENIVLALDRGANDYITKPFRIGELLARIRAAIRHTEKEGEENPVFTSGRLWMDLNLRSVKVENKEVKLTATEYSLLALLAKNAGRVLTHSFISREIWGNAYEDNAQVLRVHIAQLRKKIESNPSVPEILVTESGVGYRLKLTGDNI